MATTFSSLAMRAAVTSAWRRPSSERCRPRARPGNFTPVVEVRPWRTRRTMVEGGGFLSFIVRAGMPPHHLSPRPLRDEGVECRDAPHPAVSPSGGEGSRRSLSLPEGEGRVRVIQWPPTLPTAPRVLHRLPDAHRRGGALAQHHAELGQRVLDGVHDGSRARDGPALAHTLHAERIDD